MKGVDIAVILPTRGQPFSETIEEVLTELKPFKHTIYWSHRRSVPAAYNVPTNRALRVKRHTHFWFVDDDMIITPGILGTMLNMDVHAVGADYPVTNRGMGAAMYDKDGKAFFTGAGCLLVKTETLREMKAPIWRSDIGWQINYKPDHLIFTAGAQNPDKVYGQQDVNFGLRLYAKGQPIFIVQQTCGQRRIKNWGNRDSNKGAFEIEEWHKFHPNFFMMPNSPQKRAPRHFKKGLISIVMSDGVVVEALEEHAKRLIKSGLAKQIGYAVFNNWDFDKEEIMS